MHTNADKRRAVEEALRMRPQMSDRAIAEHCGVDHKTVSSARADAATGEIPQSTTRQGRDGRTIDTSNIGKPKSTGKPPSPVARRGSCHPRQDEGKCRPG